MPMLRTFWLSMLGTTVIVTGASAVAAVTGTAAAGASASPAAAAPAAAGANSNWELMVWTDPLVVSVDTASIARRAARIVAHVMWDYGEVQTNGAASAPYNSMLGTIVFDCATLSFGGAGSIEYSGSGGEGTMVAQYAIDPARALLGASEPGTIGRDLVTYVCAHAPPLASALAKRT